MNHSGKDEFTLPADRAFVLQFKRGTECGGSRYAGRIEHIESGHVEFFYSTGEMCAKLKTILGRKKPGPGE